MNVPNPSGLCLCGCGEPTPIAKRNRDGNVKGLPKRYVSVGHATRARAGFASTEDRFWSKVDRTGGPEACWPWLGAMARGGRAQFALAHDRTVSGHRFAYELTVGPIPDGLTLDHVCHTNDVTCIGGDSCPHRSCCNPAHLEPVTMGENVLRARTAPSAINARKTHCIRGHEFAGYNLIIDERGHRQCRECRRARDRRNQARRRAAA